METITENNAENRISQLGSILARLVEIDCYEEGSRAVEHELGRLEAELAALSD